jgi:hypothetical protein
MQICKNLHIAGVKKSRTSKYHLGFGMGEVNGNTLKNFKNGINQIEFQTHSKNLKSRISQIEFP